MKRKTPARRIPHRNKSPYGWWIAAYLERFEYYDEDRKNPNRRCLAWENTILVKARDRGTAFRKAVARGRLVAGSEAWDRDTGRRGAWHFEGLTMLLPVYDKLQDGAEVLWKQYDGKSVRKIKAKVRPKKKLETFVDDD